MAQVKGVMVLGRRGELPVGGLARELAVGLPAASAVVDRLVEHGLVRRQEDPSDRRRTLVRLSPQGEELLARLNQGSREVFETWLDNLPEPQLEQLVSGLRSLAEVAETWAEHSAAGVHSSS
ncbi:MAG TPA: MarR family transcriptional regulator [Candidatus Dormibacteraeota bacterium]|nr:MarR family transcriptional regulator [Candidatus Dormibacteraeota bacterium]